VGRSVGRTRDRFSYRPRTLDVYAVAEKSPSQPPTGETLSALWTPSIQRASRGDVESLRPAIGVVTESKLHPPRARREWIQRPQLVAELAAAARRPVVLVAAPAGYGKSTLVTQWFDSPHPPDQGAWVCLDPGDNDPTQLWSHIATALARAGCLIEQNVAEFVAMSATAVLTRVVPRVLAALAAHSDPLALVLDDCHVVRSPECCEQLDYLIDQLPPQVHLVLIARSDPALRLGRLRVDGRLSEIRSKDLSFSADEVTAVLRTEGVYLSPAAITELVRRTEGWPAAVYLAALSVRRRDDAAEFVHELSGNNRFIADYLSEEVLGRSATTSPRPTPPPD
jgi:LuxR family transcriptional regulator, maltose regulon positive regulatory protein